MSVRSALKLSLINAGLYCRARYWYRKLQPSIRRQTRCEVAFYSRLIRPGDLCFDVGAHLGTKVEALLRNGARVVAIEPEPTCVGNLQWLFGRHPGFNCVPKGVASEPGQLTLYVRKRSLSTTSFRGDWGIGDASPVDVEVTTLDRLIDEWGIPRYCKIDVEGYEVEVFRGLSRKIPLLSFEFHTKELSKAITCLEILANIADLRINVTPGDTLEFASQTWRSLPPFVDFLTREWSFGPRGDIYVEMK